jgi:N-acetylglucosaminyldiphosphoundecaprenol N-acetyl-beta-D-mannosaminyltransferase
MRFIETFGFKVFSDSLSAINIENKNQLTLNTISPNSYGISTKDHIFEEALKKSDFLVLDGVFFALSSIFLKQQNIIKNQGLDVFFYFIKKMNSESGRVFFLGASTETLAKIKTKLNIEYKNITSEFMSPPFKSNFSKNENAIMVEAINKFKPDIIFVGMTCPKQEKWVYQNKNKLDVKLICSIGAVFDWYAGNQKEIHPMWWKLRLGWLKRTIDRPEILRRYPSIGIFFWHLLLAMIGIKKFK